MATRAWQRRSEGRYTTSTPPTTTPCPPTKKLTMVTAMTMAGMPNPHPHQRANVDGRDARRGGGEVVEVEDSAVLVDEAAAAAAAASSRSGGWRLPLPATAIRHHKGGGKVAEVASWQRRLALQLASSCCRLSTASLSASLAGKARQQLLLPLHRIPLRLRHWRGHGATPSLPSPARPWGRFEILAAIVDRGEVTSEMSSLTAAR
ncbi:hypothetical protein OsJ_12728 [Oryza sativa Japonica Group]|uniref:Uncharacterized protein n=1 Tax=Oryza sativa subsp. japonica TaxID=39947 RepID=A3AN23_ORYSJ|nr:hypothetical protein OsJ_12728 [Oryza sativa Japonica Group]